MITDLAKIFLVISFLSLIYIILTKIKVLVRMPDIYCKGHNRIKSSFLKIKKSFLNSDSLKKITFEKILYNFLSSVRKFILKVEKKISLKLRKLKKNSEDDKESKDYWKKLKKTTRRK